MFWTTKARGSGIREWRNAFLKENRFWSSTTFLNDSADHAPRSPAGQRFFYVNPAGGDYFSVTGGDFTSKPKAGAPSP